MGETTENQLDATFVHPCLEILSKVMALCHSCDAAIGIDSQDQSHVGVGNVVVDDTENGVITPPFSLSAKKKKQTMIMNFFWGNAEKINLLVEILFTMSNNNS